jgi:hypothetical protein
MVLRAISYSMRWSQSKSTKSIRKFTVHLIFFIFMLLSPVVIVSMSPLASEPVKIYALAQTMQQQQETDTETLENTTQSATDTFLAQGTINQLIPFSPLQ